MSADGLSETRSGFWSSVVALFASTGTLVCCALPAVLVALGAGAALSSLVSVFPQIVWLSEHKEGLFLFAGLMLLASGAWQWRHRGAPCPTDPALRHACLRTRRFAWWVWLASAALYLVGGWFAFVLPWMTG